MILTSDYDYYLPEELIAQTPLINRSESRLMVLDKNTNTIEHKKFSDIIDYLNPGDVLVVNDTKVIPARLYGVKEETGAVISYSLQWVLISNSCQTLSYESGGETYEYLYNHL